MGFKLNDDNPGEHKAILIGGGLMLLLSMFQMFTGGGDSKSDKTKEKVQNVSQNIDEASGQISYQKTYWQNPKMTWWETIFCRGYQRSAGCSYNFKHPRRTDLEALGKKINDAPPSRDHIIGYVGPMEKTSSFSSSFDIPVSDGGGPGLKR